MLVMATGLKWFSQGQNCIMGRARSSVDALKRSWNIYSSLEMARVPWLTALTIFKSAMASQLLYNVTDSGSLVTLFSFQGFLWLHWGHRNSAHTFSSQGQPLRGWNSPVPLTLKNTYQTMFAGSRAKTQTHLENNYPINQCSHLPFHPQAVDWYQ